MGIFLGPRTDPHLFVSSAFVLHFLFQDLGKTSTQGCLDPPLPLHFVIIFGKKVLIGRELFNALPQGRNKSAQTPTSGVDKGHELRGSGLQRQPPVCVILLGLNPHESILQSRLCADNRHMAPRKGAFSQNEIKSLLMHLTQGHINLSSASHRQLDLVYRHCSRPGSQQYVYYFCTKFPFTKQSSTLISRLIQAERTGSRSMGKEGESLSSSTKSNAIPDITHIWGPLVFTVFL